MHPVNKAMLTVVLDIKGFITFDFFKNVSTLTCIFFYAFLREIRLVMTEAYIYK